jgi:transcriptional regulator with XRE-family HTH domain
MRLNSGQPLRELARRAKTSAPALVDYEAGRHEPRLSTLHRLAEASGCDLIVELRPRLTPPELRTLALHEAVVEKLHEDPELVLAKARAQLLVMRNADDENRASVYLRTWSRLLEGPVDELTTVMVSTDQPARDLRQSSPFGGVLSDKARLEVIRRAAVHT